MMRQLVRSFVRCIEFAGVVVVCIHVACTDQILPQLFAHIASLDPDHHVVVRGGSHGIDLLLSHDNAPAVGLRQTESVIRWTSSEPAHVIHFCSGGTQANQSVTPVSATKLQVARYVVATVPTRFDVFVPKAIFNDSRPPPQRTVITFNRSTLLLI